MNRKTARNICKTQIKLGKQILRSTRKAAKALLKKVPHMKSGNYSAGLRWWDFIHSLPEGEREAKIQTAAKPMMEACINKYRLVSKLRTPQGVVNEGTDDK